MRPNNSRVGCTGIIYDGVNISDTFQVVDVSVPLLPTFEAVTHELPQRPGSYFASRKVGTRQITLKLRLDAGSRDPLEIFRQWRDVSHVLDKPTPRKLYLDEDRYCWAMMVGESDIDDKAYCGEVEFTMMCFDPYFYGQERSFSLKAGSNPIDVKGACEAYPTLELTATGASVRVTNEGTGDYVLVPGTKSGSKLTMDMERQTVTMGGEYVPVDLLSDYFAITGSAKVSVSGATGTLKYRERYL